MQWQWTSPRGLVFGAPFEEKENFAKQEEHKTTKDAMGKCVSRQSAPLHELASPDAQHHQSVLTIALSHEDLAQAHKIWQRLTGSNEYIAAGPTSQQEEEPFYYTISRQRQPEQQQQREQELEHAVLHIESLYNDAAIAPAEQRHQPANRSTPLARNSCCTNCCRSSRSMQPPPPRPTTS
ncbi:GD12894 [Drosophila simulans]|uniref:GD12894 n=1 Tax=Drosophila simulans TaxID=7240 RepID=B4QNP0_DROSI|nr:GD12894 [Drosophila simulans]